MVSEPWFFFCCCQQGAEPALKSELARRLPDARFSYSRPGFCTFKMPAGTPPSTVLQLPIVFARTSSISLGRVGGSLPEQAVEVARIAGHQALDQLHVWKRDTAMPGEKGFQPGPGDEEKQLGEQLGEALLEVRPDLFAGGVVPPANRTARPGDHLLDCVEVEPGEWWIGWHSGAGIASRWAGGVFGRTLPPHAVSRSYLKMDEAIRWSGIRLRAGDRCVEIGSAPGGSCQALLDRGMTVTGIDPAEMDEQVVAHESFTHLKKRVADCKREVFRNVDWLIADANVAPQYTLDSIQEIVKHSSVHVRGMLLTLKLLEWKLADEIPAYLERIRSWGYQDVRIRQLASNRQEISVAVLKSRSFRRRIPRRR